MRLATILASVSALVSVGVSAQNLVVGAGEIVTLAGEQRYDHICVINGGMIRVAPYNGTDKKASGNLELIASSVYVDSASYIDARGAGYSGRECYHGNGSTAIAGDACNGADHDVVDDADGGVDNGVLPTGSLASCKGDLNIYDLSGNIKEWVNQPDNSGTIHVIRGGSFESPRLGLTCRTTLSQAVASTVLPGLGFRCCSDAAP